MIMVKEFGLESSASTAKFEINAETNGVYNGFTSSKRIKLSSLNNQQAKELNSPWQTRPLGLTLSKTPSFLNLLEMVLSQASTNNDSHHPSNQAHKEANPIDFSSHQYGSEKLKASNFSAISIKIGSFEMNSRYEEELVAKCYYAKKKLVWEVLEGPMKSKMEIQWSDIEAIRATMHENEPGILEIELNQPPFFFKETNPQPRKHTIWQPTSDFTGGQASKCRRHILHFPSGTLDKHYEKLLQCDLRLLELSRKPFPSGRFPYFRHLFYPSEISFAMQQANISTSFDQNHTHLLNLATDKHLHDLDLRQQDESVNACIFSNQGEENWRNESSGYLSENHIEGQNAIMASETHWEIDPDVVFDLKNVLSSNIQFTNPYRGNILATESSMCSFVDSPDRINNMPSRVLDDNFMMTNYYYQYGLSNPKMEQYESSDTSYADY